MDKMKISGKHILLMLIYSSGKSSKNNEPIDGRTRIIKMMFLFREEIKKDFLKDKNVELISFPEFFPWKYGPFSKDVYNDIEFFINNEFIASKILDTEMRGYEIEEYLNWIEDYAFEDEKELLNNIQNEERYFLTAKGEEYINTKFIINITENQKDIVSKFKQRINRASLDAILRYTYLKYPEYTKKSKINGYL